jgi:hypothetical protein
LIAITSYYENNSLSTERSELDEVNHVWFHPTFKNKLYTDEKNIWFFIDCFLPFNIIRLQEQGGEDRSEID